MLPISIQSLILSYFLKTIVLLSEYKKLNTVPEELSIWNSADNFIFFLS